MANSEKKKTFKQVCKCEKCGNEAEMVVTCSLVEVEEAEAEDTGVGKASESKRVKGTGTCSHCGNEADIWVDM